MRDLGPAEVATRDRVLQAIISTYLDFGYQRIETPALEDIARLQGGQGGENEKLIYQVLRRGLPDTVDADTPVRDLVDLGLRFDLTVPLTRFYANNQADLPRPFRSLQVGPVWRAERPQQGRFRQFYQCDIDMIGEPSVLAEAELMEATTAALGAIGLSNTVVRLSDRRFLTALANDVGLAGDTRDRFFITLDKLDKIGWDGVRAQLEQLAVPSRVVDTAVEKIAALQEVPAKALADTLANTVVSLADEVVEDLTTTTSSLDQLAEQRPLTWEFDPTLVRGMGYYTGQIFEIVLPGGSFSVAGGGRYDTLIGRTLGRDVPACGFSIGFERILGMHDDRIPRNATAVLVEPEVAITDALATARALRTGGHVVEVVRRSGKLGAQLKRLQAAGFMSFVPVRLTEGILTVEDPRTL